MSVYGDMPKDDEILLTYQKYSRSEELTEEETGKLFCFFHELVGCVNLNWKDASSQQGKVYSQIATTLDEAFALFLMKHYNKIPEPQNKKPKLVGSTLNDAMFFNEKMTEIKHLKKRYPDRMKHKDNDIRIYIKKLHACKKGGRMDDDETTEVSKEKVEPKLDNLHDFEALFGEPM